ncbi:MAG: Glu-tRNA(Gln) amidotransferase subunit GatE [Candidatus Aenigmarchaeota archaeon]|nr:Glu-tRNA(Gln) amidotransferase subunit GatE [Candidatus Aenigmarchaeota archaeon]
MTDYKALGLRAGLEIHKQLDAGHKLFCRCPIKKSEDFPLSITRRLRPAAGELDVVDPAAIYEFLRNKKFVYKHNPESTCLIELDEKPPDPVNPAALETVLKISRMLGAQIVDEVHVMRKTIIDGSSVSGFQRTALIAMNGSLETSFGEVGIRTISLEEDSATALQKGHDFIEYRLDRLGVPLVEIATSAEMHTPQQAKEVAESLGMLLRSFPVVRGIGSIRQDVNVSIESGARVEIKGFQELEKIPQLVENEVKRQTALLEIKEELHRRGLKELKEKPKDVTALFRDTRASFIERIIASNGRVFALKLPKFAGLLRKGCGDRTFGKELAAYAEAYGFGGIIHSDEDLNKYKLTQDFARLKKELKIQEQDLVLILAGHDNVEKAMNTILERARHCLIGVPEETRVADGMGSKYTRPLPGSGRLYPESDIPAIRIDKNYVAKLKLPKTLKEIKEELSEELTEELAKQLVRSRYFPLFEEFKNFGPRIVATTFLSTFTDLRRRGFPIEKITRDHLFKVFSLVQKGKFSKTALPQIFEQLASGVDVDEVISKFETLSKEEIEKAVKSIVAKNTGKSESVIIGLVMQQLRGRADGRLVAELVRREMK